MLSKYYYNQLNSTGKTVYDALIMGLEQRQKEIRVPELPNEKVMAAIRMENPQLYFVDFSVWNVTEFMGIHKIAPTYMYDERQCDTINAKAEALYRRFAPLEGEYFLRKVHNYFVRTVSYDETEKGKTPLLENHSLVGSVINGRGVCEGISFAFDFLLKRKGFDCTVVMGMCEGEGHMWNVVCLNGNNYHIDVTNDITQTGSCFDKPCYFYYLITDDAMRKTATFEERFQCTQTADNPFYLSRKMFGDDGLRRYLAVLPRDTRTVFFKYIGSKGEREVAQTVAERLLVQGGSLVSSVDKTGTIYYFTAMGG